jgi:uncharacterized protein (DUF4415 family)
LPFGIDRLDTRIFSMPNMRTQRQGSSGEQDCGSSTTRVGSEGGQTQPIKRRPGRPPIENPKQAVSLRLEPEVLEKFRATGAGWQRRMNDVLKAAKLGD